MGEGVATAGSRAAGGDSGGGGDTPSTRVAKKSAGAKENRYLSSDLHIKPFLAKKKQASSDHTDASE